MLTVQGANFYEQRTVIATNRTGAPLVIGGVYALDITASDATSTNGDLAMGNLVAVSAANIRGFLVVAMSAMASLASGQVLLKGRVNVLVDGSGTNIAKGDRLKPTAASTNLTQLAATQLVAPCAIALATATTAGALIDSLFNGENWLCERAAS